MCLSQAAHLNTVYLLLQREREVNPRVSRGAAGEVKH